MSVGLAWPGAARPVGAPTRGTKITQDVGVVTLAAPELEPAPAPPQSPPPAPLPRPVATVQSPLSAPPPLPHSMVVTLPSEVRPAAHAESPMAVTRPAPAARVPGPLAPTFFAVRAVGNSIVYVIDRSSSMGIDGRFDRAREQVIASLRQLPAEARFQVIAYDRTALTLRVGGGGLASATPANVETAAAVLSAMAPEGATDHVRALRLALSLRPDVIYFLTDEDDLTAADVAEIRRLNGLKTSIHALCLVAPSAVDTPMQILARQNRGEFRVVGP
jgi:hypothetical protein